MEAFDEIPCLGKLKNKNIHGNNGTNKIKRTQSKCTHSLVEASAGH
jgi:hypothetical protein